MPEVKAKASEAKRGSCVAVHIKSIDNNRHRKLALEVIKAEMATKGLQERYLDDLTKLKNKIENHTVVEFSSEEARLFVGVVEAFCVLEGQNWPIAKIRRLCLLYDNLGGRQDIEIYWSFWKKLALHNNADCFVSNGKKFCPHCGQRMK